MNEFYSKRNNLDNFIGSANWGASKYWFYENFRVHFRVTGNESDPPIVLIHGFGASSDHWRYNAEVFSTEGFRVYGIDLIGFGKSEQYSKGNTNYFDNEFWADQLVAFLEEVVEVQRNGKVILIGNSLGSLTAITTLSKRPDLIKTVISAPLPEPVFVNPFQPLFPSWFNKAKRFLIKLFFYLLPLKTLINLISKKKLITFALQGAYFRQIKKDNSLKRIVTVPARRPNAYKALRSMCIGMSNRPNSAKGPSILSKIKNITNRPPILLIWGKQDKLIPLFLAKKLIKLHPWLKLTVIDDVGHCPHDESPNHFNQIVLKWLKNF